MAEGDEAPRSMEEMLDRFQEAAAVGDEVSVDDILDAVGRRSFGPLMLLAGIVMSAPGLSDVPGVGTVTGLYILLISLQILWGRQEFWLPQWLLRRKVASKRLKKISDSRWIRKPAEWIDRFTHRRLKALAGPRMDRVVAGVATVLAILSPLTEVVPMSGVGVGAAVVALGIALIVRDGVMTLIGLLLSAITVGLAVATLG